MEALNASRSIAVARAVGCADHSIDFIQNRNAVGQKVSDFQGVRWMPADMTLKTDAARLWVYRTAVDVGVSDRELRPHGGHGQVLCLRPGPAGGHRRSADVRRSRHFNAYPINRHSRDAKVVQIIGGTNQIERSITVDRPSRSGQAQVTSFKRNRKYHGRIRTRRHAHPSAASGQR